MLVEGWWGKNVFEVETRDISLHLNFIEITERYPRYIKIDN